MEQIAFLNDFVRYYGISSLKDYTTKISLKTLTNPDLVNQINLEINKIKTLYKPSSLNLSKYKYIISNNTQAFSLLKTLLKLSSIPYELVHTHKGNLLRLKPPNNIELVIKYEPVNEINVETTLIKGNNQFTRLVNSVKKQNVIQVQYSIIELFNNITNIKIDTYDPQILLNIAHCSIKEDVVYSCTTYSKPVKIDNIVQINEDSYLVKIKLDTTSDLLSNFKIELLNYICDIKNNGINNPIYEIDTVNTIDNLIKYNIEYGLFIHDFNTSKYINILGCTYPISINIYLKKNSLLLSKYIKITYDETVCNPDLRKKLFQSTESKSINKYNDTLVQQLSVKLIINNNNYMLPYFNFFNRFKFSLVNKQLEQIENDICYIKIYDNNKIYFEKVFYDTPSIINLEDFSILRENMYIPILICVNTRKNLTDLILIEYDKWNCKKMEKI